MIAINSTNMMRMHNQWQQSNFQPIKVLFLLNKGIFKYLTVWLWSEAQLCPFQIIGMPPSIHIVMVQNHYKHGFHASWRNDQIPTHGVIAKILYELVLPQDSGIGLEHLGESYLPKSDDILRERHISVSQPCRRTHWQSKLACLRGTLLKDLAGQ